MLFLISLFFTAALSVDISTLEPHLFSQVLSDTSAEDAQAAIDAVHALIAVGEAERGVAEHNLSVATGIWTTANDNWKRSYTAEQAALGEQATAEDDEEEATKARNAATTFRDEKITEHTEAKRLVPIAKKFMQDEIARVDDEKETLEKVLDILRGILNGKHSAIQTGVLSPHSRNLLSRTTILLSNPTFLSSLSKADPKAIEKVIKLVDDLIQAGEDDRNFAVGDWRTKTSEAEVARENLVNAEGALTSRANELVEATQVRVDKTAIAEGKTAVEVEKRGVRDAKKEKMDIQAEFTNREIARVDSEKVIYEKALKMLGILKKIIIVLQ